MRNINQLHPVLQLKVSDLEDLCSRNGLKIGISECLRTAAEQDAFYAQGRTKPGNIVTNARGSTYSSQHQWGIAFDFYRNDGKGLYNDSDGFFYKVGNLAKSIGLAWGGDWTSIKDKPHLYLPQWGSTTAQLKQKYGTPDKFFASWTKNPVFEPKKTYSVIKACYLRSSSGAKDNKVKYKVLPDSIKKKCRKKFGYAVFKKGKVFHLIRSAYSGGNIWGQTESGYWVPLIYKGEVRVK